ncbi:MAG TPA: hypothetical protein VHM30_01885 [Gemmatimonadaceae bacterium]|nr:hypothetical protein [Gemmatimonadaceae bacterium]
MPNRPTLRPAMLAGFALAAIVTSACAPRASVAPVLTMPARDTVVISDAPYGAYVGSPVSIGARVWRGGEVVPDAPVEWSAAPAGVARIDADGTLTPVREGHVVITAKAGRMRSRRMLLVQQAPEQRAGLASRTRQAARADSIPRRDH